jgi:hypothetical protein
MQVKDDYCGRCDIDQEIGEAVMLATILVAALSLRGLSSSRRIASLTIISLSISGEKSHSPRE